MAPSAWTAARTTATKDKTTTAIAATTGRTGREEEGVAGKDKRGCKQEARDEAKKD